MGLNAFNIDILFSKIIFSLNEFLQFLSTIDPFLFENPFNEQLSLSYSEFQNKQQVLTLREFFKIEGYLDNLNLFQ